MDTTNKRILISSRAFLGAVAKWATEQSPYPYPENLEVVLGKLHKNTAEIFSAGELGFVRFEDFRQVVAFVKEQLRAIPEYMFWNERKNGRQGYGFSGAGHDDSGEVVVISKTPSPDDDFIDLDALERNVSAELVNRD